MSTKVKTEKNTPVTMRHMLTLVKSSRAQAKPIFQKFLRVLMGGSRNIFRMYAISFSIPIHPGPIAVTDPEIAFTELFANELAGYRFSMSRESASRKILLHSNLNARDEVCMSQDLRIYSNSEYVYASSPNALVMRCDKGRREIAMSKPLSTIFTILMH